jgi:hypothetical protein
MEEKIVELLKRIGAIASEFDAVAELTFYLNEDGRVSNSINLNKSGLGKVFVTFGLSKSNYEDNIDSFLSSDDDYYRTIIKSALKCPMFLYNPGWKDRHA